MRARYFFPLVLFLWVFGSLSMVSAQQTEEAHFRPDCLAAIDEAVHQAIEKKWIPGGVIWLENRGHIYHRAYGNRMVDPEIHPMTTDTIFDAASLTKVTATAPSILKLIENGSIKLDAPASRYLPLLKGQGKENVTVRQLLTHTSGLKPVISRKTQWQGVDAALKLAFKDTVLNPPGTAFRYSDINYILLGEMVRTVSGKVLDVFAHEHIYEPLGMTDTGFRPTKDRKNRIAPTTREADGLVHGVVHDPVARRMGGVAGHAGLFVTAEDLARYARMFLNNGAKTDGNRVFEKETLQMMIAVQSPESIKSKRGLGWDIDSGYSSLRGRYFGKGSFGHTGWTGTSIWIDRASETFLIFLSNRNHPSESGKTKALRIQLANLAAESLPDFPRGLNTPPTVLNGIDVLVRDGFSQLKSKTVGLITNHTGLSAEGKTTIDLLHDAESVKLDRLFSPEHGIRGNSESKVEDGRDAKTGLPVYSLYGKRKHPTLEQLKDLDVLVFDIQDIGCRFYTYVSTMGLCMEAATRAGVEFTVLDRINPIGGLAVEGPVLKTGQTFTGFHSIPLRHGMTVGELARMFKKERGLESLELNVVELENWSRSFYQDQCGTPWTPPSPNMRNLTEAVLYPGVGLLEFMNISVGRGTNTPFELVGAPYIDGERLSELANEIGLPGINFEPAYFTPTKSVFKDRKCRGVRIKLTDRHVCRAVDIGMVLATILHREWPEPLGYGKFSRLLMHPDTFRAVRTGMPLKDITDTWKDELRKFRKRRQEFLLY